MPGSWELRMQNWPLRATHMVHLRTGKILVWDASLVYPTDQTTKAYLWDPAVPAVFVPAD